MTQPSPQHNLPEYTVSEIANALKRTVEDRFGYVRVRGEISGWRGPHSSGHGYFRIKDDKALLDAVCWKGSLAKLPFRMEEGLEVVASGKITTYPGKSTYQLVVERMEPAGVGALMALLEKRKAMLAAEGLFAPERKRMIPFLPETIGIITSPTGAVIRDILHRLRERCPRRVILYPVAVQGEGAAEQVAAAIRWFNACEQYGLCPKPDVLIVARGGGSIEDLWAFNEETVIRAVAEGAIPLISAVGHETDTTLIDFVSDKRAPTPTAAAEMAVPVLAELRLYANELRQRMDGAMLRGLESERERLSGLARGLPQAQQLLGSAQQRFDDWGERLYASLPALVEKRMQALRVASAGLRPQTLLQPLGARKDQLDALAHRLQPQAVLERKSQQLAVLSASLKPQLLAGDVAQMKARLDDLAARLARPLRRLIEQKARQAEYAGNMLSSLSHESALKRGFALVRDGDGRLITRAAQARQAQALELEFLDGKQVVRH